MKTLILWKPKRCRIYKVQGTATAECSAIRIRDFQRMAEEGKGTVAIVDAESADDARRIIQEHESGQSDPAIGLVKADGRILALGSNAVLAIAGAAHAIANWQSRIDSQGKVSRNQSRALRSDVDPLQFLSPDAIFQDKATECPAVPQCSYRENIEKDGIEITFASRPEARILSMLRSAGFRWHRRGKYWYARRSDSRKRLALALVNQGGPIQ